MPKEKTDGKPAYGGQAVIEGVMMRGPRFFAVACRRENNEIVVRQECIETTMKGFQWMNKPFLRGALAMIDSMVLGIKALTYSADIAMADAQPSDAAEKLKAADDVAKSKSQSINDITIGITMVLGVLLGLMIFIGAPQYVVGLLQDKIHSAIWKNIAAGGVKLILFVGYIAVISRMNDVKRVFQYHGAEHKVINTFESGQELCPENFCKHTTIHPRCGTSFLLVVVLVSTIIYIFLGWKASLIGRIGIRLLFLPLIAGIAYEVIRFAGKHRDSKIMKALLAPGLWMQKLTTNEPTDDQIEVALCALKAVMEKEQEAAGLNEASAVCDK